MKIIQVLSKAYKILKEVNIDTYILDAQLLLQYVLKKDKLFIILNKEFNLSKEDEDKYFKLIELRKNKMPIKYILGECEFMGLNLNVKEGVLIPRPDTEILVEEAIKQIKDNKYTEICDLCCGSGAIGISIGNYIENCNVYCYDISDIAYDVTFENIIKLNLNNKVKVFKSDLLSRAIEENKKFDVIVSNPPYIKNQIIPTLMEDVKNYEPYIALSGGEDGLDFYRQITKESLNILNKGGLLAFEIGHDQGLEVQKLLKDNKFKFVRIVKDLAGLDRVVMGIRD